MEAPLELIWHEPAGPALEDLIALLIDAERGERAEASAAGPASVADVEQRSTSPVHVAVAAKDALG